eukprot:gene26505-57382_t
MGFARFRRITLYGRCTWAHRSGRWSAPRRRRLAQCNATGGPLGAPGCAGQRRQRAADRRKDGTMFVRDCPASKRPQLWLKVRGEAERLFGSESPLCAEDNTDEVGHLVTQATAVCGLVKQFALSGESHNIDISGAASAMHRALKGLYGRPEVQAAMADALCALVEKKIMNTETMMRGGEDEDAEGGHLLMWCVWECTQAPVTAADVRRLWAIRDGFKLIAWGDDGFLYQDHSKDLLKLLFAQHLTVTETLHRKLLVTIIQAERDCDRAQLVDILAEIWGSLEGIHVEAFEQEVIRVYVDCAIKADTKYFDSFRFVLNRLASYGGANRRAVARGLPALLENSALFTAFDSPNALYRCNAGADKATFEMAKTDQIQKILEGMKDDCPVVRCHAAGAMCRGTARRSPSDVVGHARREHGQSGHLRDQRQQHRWVRQEMHQHQ